MSSRSFALPWLILLAASHGAYAGGAQTEARSLSQFNYGKLPGGDAKSAGGLNEAERHVDEHTLNTRAGVFMSRRDYASAEPLLKRALVIVKNKFGAEHANVARALNNLATLYVADGKYDQAESHLKGSLTIWEKARGPDHPDVASCLHNMGILYSTQGKYAQAETLFKRAVAAWEKIGDSTNRAVSLRNLSMVYEKLGRTKEAERATQTAERASRSANVHLQTIVKPDARRDPPPTLRIVVPRS